MSFWSRGGEEDIDNEVENLHRLERMRAKRRRNENNRNAANALARDHAEAERLNRTRKELGLNRPKWTVRQKDCPPCPVCPPCPERQNFRIPSLKSKVNLPAMMPNPLTPTLPLANRQTKYPPMVPQQIQAQMRPVNMLGSDSQTDMMMQMQRNLHNSMEVQRAQGEALNAMAQILVGMQKVGEDTKADVLEVSEKQTQQLNSLAGKSFFELTWAQTPDWLKLKMKQAATKTVYKAGKAVVDLPGGSYVRGAKYALGPIGVILDVTVFVVVTSLGMLLLYNMGPVVYGAVGQTVQEGLNQVFHVVKPLAVLLKSELMTATATQVAYMDALRMSFCAGLPFYYRKPLQFGGLC